MPVKTSESIRLCLSGDWTISGVSKQFPLLAQHLARLSENHVVEAFPTCAAPGLPEMDLAGITELDACGCQLLAEFSLALQQCGFSPRMSNIPETLIPKVGLLGFDRAFNLSL